MTKLTINGFSSHFATQEDRPAGALKSIEEIRDNSKVKCMSEIRVFTVEQLGYITECIPIEFHHAASYHYSHGVMSVPFLICVTKVDWTSTGFNLFNLWLGEYGLDGTTGTTEHQAFLTRKDAEDYSNWLQANEEYKESIKRWHAHCDTIMPDYYDYDD